MASQLRRRSRESAEQVVRLVQAVSCSSSSQQQQLHSSLQGLGTQHLLFSPPHHSCLGSWNWGSCRHLGFAAAAHAQLRPDVQQRSLEQQPASAGDTSLNFRLKVITGNLRGAGTKSTAQLRLIGAGNISEPVSVGSDELGHLDRGSIRTVEVRVPSNFGDLRRVHVEKDRDEHTGDGWFLQHIEVEGPEGHTMFPCNAWFGESDCGGLDGPQERNLVPAVLGAASSSQPGPVRMTASGLAIPHPEKVTKAKLKGYNTRAFGYGGEDAYFIAKSRYIAVPCPFSNGTFGMGVADGVYMWREQGIDSGIMSRLIMDVCRQQVELGNDDVMSMLEKAMHQVATEKVLGSTTLCVLTINPATGQLHSANLGDSGFLVLSPSKTHTNPRKPTPYHLCFRTNQLEHRFGCPFQVGHQESANKIADSDSASFFVHPGDIIVMGSDGLLDNVSDQEILDEVTQSKHQGLSPAYMAQRITKLAFEASVDKQRVTPYSQGASEAFDMVYSGGKLDDITVLVCLIGDILPGSP